MFGDSRLLKIVVFGVVILAVVLALGFVIGGLVGWSTDDDNRPVPLGPWQLDPELKQAFFERGFTCQRQTYSSLAYGGGEVEAALVEKMVVAGIAEAELELCNNESIGVTFGGGLPEEVSGLFGVYSDFRCQMPGQIDFLGLSDAATVFLVNGVYYLGNRESDTDVLRGILDDLEMTYSEGDQLTLESCEG